MITSVSITETEFRRRFAMRGLPSDGVAVAAAIEVVRDLGLLFAPEPVALPERIELREHGGIAACSLWPVGRDSMTVSERRAMEGAAADRYNAYPGLRKAAEAAQRGIMNLLFEPITAVRLRTIESLADDLAAELAKGPK